MCHDLIDEIAAMFSIDRSSADIEADKNDLPSAVDLHRCSTARVFVRQPCAWIRYGRLRARTRARSRPQKATRMIASHAITTISKGAEGYCC